MSLDIGSEVDLVDLASSSTVCVSLRSVERELLEAEREEREEERPRLCRLPRLDRDDERERDDAVKLLSRRRE